MDDVEDALHQLRRRERQAAVLADLGHCALSVDDLQVLFDQAVAQVAEALGIRFCKVLKLLPGSRELLLVAGVGWKQGLVGQATVPAGLDSQAGYTLQSDRPVVVEDLRSEARFSGPLLLSEHGVVSGMSVIIGPQGHPWGVLGTHSNELKEFTGEDTYFIQAVANTLWDAIHRRQIEDSLREADRRKDEFLAVLAHELRNPLASISTALEVISLTDDPTANAESRAIARRQVDHLSRLVDDLLEVSRIGQGRLKLKKQRVQLREVIDSAVADNQHFIDRQHHSLSVTFPDESIFLDADPVRLSQVFGNLLNNAAKYTPEGGVIEIRIRPEQAGVSIVVRDNGIGIPTAYLGAIFEMFAGLNQPAEMTQKGLGIGLSLVRSLIEMHGGTVEARSEGPGKGSEFIVWLPAARRAEETDDAPNRDTREPASTVAKRVLVVEDNDDAATSLAKLLQVLGQETCVAHDGIEALKAASVFRPDIILLDIGLPKLNGYEVARCIREKPWGNKILLAAVTGWGQEHDRDRAREVGIDRHITKPLTLPVLKEVLAGLPAPGNV